MYVENPQVCSACTAVNVLYSRKTSAALCDVQVLCKQLFIPQANSLKLGKSINAKTLVNCFKRNATHRLSHENLVSLLSNVYVYYVIHIQTFPFMAKYFYLK